MADSLLISVPNVKKAFVAVLLNVWIACLQSHQELVAGVLDLASKVQHDKQLTALIRRKFAIKCTTGYSLNALVDFSLEDPIEIIKRLMIGSEGTFGFVSQATYNCVPEWPHKVGLSCIAAFSH